MLKTHVGFCIDESGSVRKIVRPLVKAYNSNVKSIKDSVLKEGQEASMTALAFGDINLKHRILYTGQQVQTVEPLKVTDLNPTGMTPLFDSVYRAIKKLSELDDGDENTAFIITTVTDGHENNSRDPGVSTTLSLIQEKTATDRWTFTFLVPLGNAFAFSRNFSIPLGNIQEWETTSVKGTEDAFIVNAKAYENYFTSRGATGMRSTNSFYADLTDVTVRKARSELSEITNQVTIIQPKHDCLIKQCIEESGNPYIKGAAFYQLIKTERKVQPYKLVAIRAKTSGKIYCGDEARVMLGIDVGHTVRLVPGDHGKFDVFIQSTSYTRKIPGGTLVLYWPKVGTQRK